MVAVSIVGRHSVAPTTPVGSALSTEDLLPACAAYFCVQIASTKKGCLRSCGGGYVSMPGPRGVCVSVALLFLTLSADSVDYNIRLRRSLGMPIPGRTIFLLLICASAYP